MLWESPSSRSWRIEVASLGVSASTLMVVLFSMGSKRKKGNISISIPLIPYKKKEAILGPPWAIHSSLVLANLLKVGSCIQNFCLACLQYYTVWLLCQLKFIIQPSWRRRETLKNIACNLLGPFSQYPLIPFLHLIQKLPKKLISISPLLVFNLLSLLMTF